MYPLASEAGHPLRGLFFPMLEIVIRIHTASNKYTATDKTLYRARVEHSQGREVMGNVVPHRTDRVLSTTPRPFPIRPRSAPHFSGCDFQGHGQATCQS